MWQKEEKDWMELWGGYSAVKSPHALYSQPQVNKSESGSRMK